MRERRQAPHGALGRVKCDAGALPRVRRPKGQAHWIWATSDRTMHDPRMSPTRARTPDPIWREWPLVVAVVTLTLALLASKWITSHLDEPAGLIARLVVICIVILIAAFAIVRHADVVAHRLGEPAGTLLLTLTI